ncbi:3'-5' exonuclease [Lentzea pudingi]|nr:3'-5' exonuclease [Lentzea pudingi]
MQPGSANDVGGWLEREFDGDVWRTMLYDIQSARPLHDPALVRSILAQTPPKPVASNRVSAQREAAAWARDVLADDMAVVIDTELTDFAGRVIEIAVLTTDGTVLLNTLVDLEGAMINPMAQRKHRITAAMLSGAPTMARLWPRLETLLRGRKVIAWNATFDQTRLRAEHRRITAEASEPAWLTRPWDCAMRRHASWVGDSNSRGTGFRNHKLEGGHRASGDCQAVLERLNEMASSLKIEPTPIASTTALSGPDVHAVRAVWPQLLLEIRQRSRSTEAMLTNAELLSVENRTLVVHHASVPIARRLAAARNTTVMSEALSALLGTGWTVAIDTPGSLPQSHDQTPDRSSPAVPEDNRAEELGSEPYRTWQDTQHGLDLESWIEIAPASICDAVKEPEDVDASRNDHAQAFYAVNHSKRCAPEAACRTILRLADEGWFEEAKRLAELLWAFTAWVLRWFDGVSVRLRSVEARSQRAAGARRHDEDLDPVRWHSRPDGGKTDSSISLQKRLLLALCVGVLPQNDTKSSNFGSLVNAWGRGALALLSPGSPVIRRSSGLSAAYRTRSYPQFHSARSRPHRPSAHYLPRTLPVRHPSLVSFTAAIAAKGELFDKESVS